MTFSPLRLPAAGLVLLCLLFTAATAGATAPVDTMASTPTADGPIRIKNFLDKQQLDQAQALTNSLLAAPPGPADAEAALLTAAIKTMLARNDWTLLDGLAKRIDAVVANAKVPVKARADLLHVRMMAYSRTARFEDAQRTLDTSLALMGDAPSEGLLDALRAKGGIHAQQGQFPQAIEALLRAEKVTAALGQPVDVGILRNLGGIFINLGEFKRAVEYATRAEQASRSERTKDGDPPNPASRFGALATLATAHIAAGNSTEARAWSQTAIDFGRANNQPIGGVLNNLASLLRDEGQNAEALARFKELEATIDEKQTPELRGVVAKNIGETLIALNRRAEADTQLQRARKLYESADNRPKRLELYPILIDNLEALARPADALKAMREFKALSDEIISTESKARIGALESTIDLERKNAQLAQAKAANSRQLAENEALRIDRSRARTTNLALVGALLAVLAFLAGLWRNHRIRSRSHRELAERNTAIEEQRNALEVLNAAIYKQSREDALTGLANRRHLLELMATPEAAAGGLLVMADLDEFKQINDRHGHDVGDRALRLFADALRSVARSGDVLVRWGGEEFVWLCPNTGVDHGGALCERLLQHLREHPLMVDGQELRVGVSLGFAPLAIWPGTETDWEAALRIADHGVYRAKAAGRGTWIGFAGANAPPVKEDVPVAILEERGYLRRMAS